MASSNAGKFSFKSRNELDDIIFRFERDVSRRLAELQAHCGAYADTILSMTSAEDDQYVHNRISAILASRGLLTDDSTAHNP
jgi:hypothetical protein